MQIKNQNSKIKNEVSPSRLAGFEILLRVEREQAYAVELLHSSRLDGLSHEDRGLAFEITMGVLRWRSRLDAAIKEFSFTPFHKLDVEVLTALRIGAYQLMFLERIPARAAVNEGVELVKRSKKSSAAGMANVVLRKISGVAKRVSAHNSAVPSAPEVEPVLTLEVTPASLASTFAHPLWLVERWADNYGLSAAHRICASNQKVPSTHIRLRGDAASTERELREQGIELAPGNLMRNARIVVSGDITHTAACTDGRLTIQDEGSQLIAALVGAGEHILDCCAAPGGKTSAIADRNPQARIVAAEIHAHRARLMHKLITAPNVEIIHADTTALPFADTFDRVLADVPCSGTGTLARNPEIKWRLKPEDLADLHARQAAILTAALDRLTPGGELVYSSCSLEPEENAAVIEEVMRTRPEFELLDVGERLAQLQSSGDLVWPDPASLTRGPYLRTLPGVHPCDGFFAALIRRRL
jgi:16S rRNA (cytosine967-C5)-methyltransferase